MSSADERIINRLERIAAAQGEGGASFEELTGNPSDNAALAAALDAKGPAPSDTAYDATTWNGVTTIAPSKNAVRDKVDAMDTTIATKQTAAQVATAIAAAGGKLLDTTGAPDNGIGANGDYAFDDATKTIYGPKAAGVWPAGVALAPSGGVIGNAIITIDNADGVTVDYVDGVFVGASASNFSYVSGSGGLTVTTPISTGANPFPQITWESVVSLSYSISSVSDGAFTATFLNSTTGAAAGNTVDVVRISILKLSQ